MIRFSVVVLVVVSLGACCNPPARTSAWFEYASTGQLLSEDQMREAQEAALLRYRNQPNDENRMTLAWLLSQGNPSPQQLDSSLELIGEISADGKWAVQRNLLHQDVQTKIALQTARGKLLQLETQLETRNAELETRNAELEALQAQIEAMKDIETRMTEEIDPEHSEQ